MTGSDNAGPPSRALLSRGDPPPARVENPGGGAPFLIVCDHAGRRVPRRLGRLGLAPEAFGRHIALDIGAEGVALRLAQALGAPAVLQAYSRLVVDCNRAPDHPDLIVQVADGMPVPGNAGLAPEAAAARLDEIHRPYHAAIAAGLDACLRVQPATVLVSIHSFTPSLGGRDRPWGFGVLHQGDSPLSQAVLQALRASSNLPVGDNEPYAMDGVDYTAPFHAGGRGLDYLELEIRQDLVASPAGQARVAGLLAEVLTRAAA